MGGGDLQWVGTGRHDAQSEVLGEINDFRKLLEVTIDDVGEECQADDDLHQANQSLSTLTTCISK